MYKHLIVKPKDDPFDTALQELAIEYNFRWSGKNKGDSTLDTHPGEKLFTFCSDVGGFLAIHGSGAVEDVRSYKKDYHERKFPKSDEFIRKWFEWVNEEINQLYKDYLDRKDLDPKEPNKDVEVLEPESVVILG